MAKIIFNNKEKKERIDFLTTKYVASEIEKKAKNEKEYEYVIIDAPLLFETNLDKICNVTIGVIADFEKCIDRIVKRDGISKEEAVLRISNQNKQNFFKQKCDYLVFNNKPKNLDRQINDIVSGKNLSNNVVIHVYDNGIEYLQFRKLLPYSDKIQHCYTLKPFDFCKNKNYEGRKEQVLCEYKRLFNSLDLNYKNIYRPYQMHTDVVKIVDNEEAGIFTEDFKYVDGLVTNKKDKILSLSYADCIALLIYDTNKNIIANIHSGWRGTYKEIAKLAVRRL